MEEVQSRLDGQRQLLRTCDKEISERLHEQQKLNKQMNQAQLHVQETEHRLSKMTKDSRDAARQVTCGWGRIGCCGRVILRVASLVRWLHSFFDQ